MSIHVDGSGEVASKSSGKKNVQLQGLAGARPRLTMVQPPAPIYAARPPIGTAGAVAGAVVYGIYSAVSLADPVRLCRLRDELPELLKAGGLLRASSRLASYTCILVAPKLAY